MTADEFRKIQQTFPWTERTVMTSQMGGIVQVLDNAGNEVPLFTITAFLGMITRRLKSATVEDEPKEQ